MTLQPLPFVPNYRNDFTYRKYHPATCKRLGLMVCTECPLPICIDDASLSVRMRVDAAIAEGKASRWPRVRIMRRVSKLMGGEDNGTD